MRKISVCGVDGSGKTTLLREIEERARAARRPVAVLRAPQYFDGNDLAVNRAAERLEALGARADEEKDPALKACALFLGMTLYGAAESELVEKSACKVLFRERDPIADSITYAQVYVALLKAAFPPAVAAAHGDEHEDHLRALKQRESLGFERLSFAELPLYIRALFSLPAPELVGALERLYRTTAADVAVLLRLTPARMHQRMELKAAERHGRGPELHERLDVLVRLQAGMEQALGALQSMRGVELVTLDVGEHSAGDLAAELIRRYADPA